MRSYLRQREHRSTSHEGAVMPNRRGPAPRLRHLQIHILKLGAEARHQLSGGETAVSQLGNLLESMSTAVDRMPPLYVTLLTRRQSTDGTHENRCGVGVAPGGRWIVLVGRDSGPFAGGDGELIWHRAGHLNPSYSKNPASRLLDPSWLLSRRRISIISSGRHEGRDSTECHGESRLTTSADRREEAEFSVDSELGILLRLHQRVGDRFVNDESLQDVSLDHGRDLLDGGAFSVPEDAVLVPTAARMPSRDPAGHAGNRLARATPYLISGLRELLRGS